MRRIAKNRGVCSTAVAILLNGLLSPYNAAAAQLPSWFTAPSALFTETYDDNLYMAGRIVPASFAVPAGSVAAFKGLSSWVATLSPKIGIDFAPLLDNPGLQVFSLAYAPDFAFYHDAPTENYDAHRFPTVVKGEWGSIHCNVDNTLSIIGGSKEAPTYPGGFENAYSPIAPRNRREQLNDMGVADFRYDHDRWFIRPTGSILYYDMKTALIDATGYQNYVSRYDVNGGADFGYRFGSQLSFTLGYRYGHQYQEGLPFSRYSSSSDYQRELLGVEGKMLPWLEAKISGGPDFRSYPSDTTTHITPVNNKHPVYYYGEAALTALVSTEDKLSFTYKQFMFVSQLGQIPYFDSSYILSFHHTIDRLSVNLAASILTSDYTSGYLASSRRDDLDQNLTATLNYAFDSHISFNLVESYDAARNALAGVVNPQTRAIYGNSISIGTLMRF